MRNLVAFVQGTSRGIGLEYVRQLAEKPEVAHIYASCRAPDKADALQSLASRYPGQITIVRLDVTDEESIEAAASHVLDHSERLHLLINCAGVLHAANRRFKPEKRLEDCSLAQLEWSFRVNAFGPLMVVKHFYPLFKHSEPSVVVNMSARVGSIADNNLGGWYSYRSSKAALNMLTRNMSLELRRRSENTVVLALHPGTTDTDLSRPFQANVPRENLFSVDRSVGQLLTIIFAADQDRSGRFIAWDGQDIPW
jgi:NAD(P)-dependent dehydrogenase (short-subunit alcohol dehydrogenase family)